MESPFRKQNFRGDVDRPDGRALDRDGGDDLHRAFADFYLPAWEPETIDPWERLDRIVRERERIGGKRAKLLEDLKKAEARLANEGFVGRGPAEVVERERRRLRELQGWLAALEAALRALDETRAI
ncbi:MAG: hypothetical protein FJY82_12560 [Candidatus Aminicenantes bacterium]|nr:hypothetical protein [Candidatus Aminicenantes bacterium]